MSLCDLCKSIPLDGLPPFPDEHVAKTLSGLPYFHQFYLRGETLESVGFRHYPDLQSLRDAAAAGCAICNLIEPQADNVLSDWNSLSRRDQSIYRQPQFDLWLTKPPNNRAGVLVLTNAGVGVGRSAINLVAAIGFSATEGDPIDTHFSGRPVRSTLDRDTLYHVIEWVKRCDGHKDCQRTGLKIPPRLIDVGSATQGSSIRIVNIDKNTVGRYVALSHRYTHRDISQADLLPMSRDMVEMTALPKTFHDAVVVTRELGVQYLWIDELCIASEDTKEWTRESANVGAVFSNAYLTLAATGATDTAGGLFLPRKPREYVLVHHTTAAGIEKQILAHVLPLDKEAIDSYYLYMQSEALSSDAWAFQDRVLSFRTLHFASDQIYLECQESFISEDGLYLSDTSTYGGFRFGCIPQDKEKAISAWHGMLSVYSRRLPENNNDKLPAIANVARAYGEVLGDEYIAGLWKQHLVESLTWQSIECSKDQARYNAPSWSWASYGGLTARGRRRGRAWQPVATLLDYHIDPEGQDSFGSIKEAWIKLESPLFPLHLAEKTGPTGHIYMRSLKGNQDGEYAGLDVINRESEKSRDTIKAMEVYCLVLGLFPQIISSCSTGGCTPGPRYHCILVTPIGEGEFMKRIGFIIITPESITAEDLETRKVVTLK